MTKPIVDLVESVIPQAALARSAKGDVAKEAAGEAVRAATSWFLDEDALEFMRDSELDKMAVGQILLSLCKCRGLSRDKASAVCMGVELLSEAVQIAATGEQHVWGGIRPRRLSEKDIDFWLRSGIQGLINFAIYFNTGDISMAAKAQERAAGIELDLQALIAALDGQPGPSPTLSLGTS